jgi:hypothetical protein
MFVKVIFRFNLNTYNLKRKRRSKIIIKSVLMSYSLVER